MCDNGYRYMSREEVALDAFYESAVLILSVLVS